MSKADEYIQRIEYLARMVGQPHLEFWTEFATYWEDRRHIMKFNEALMLTERHVVCNIPLPWNDINAIAFMLRQRYTSREEK